MKKINIILILLICSCLQISAQSWIRINQLGYLPQLNKVAVYISQVEGLNSNFSVINSLTNEVVLTDKAKSTNAKRWGMKSSARLDFSKLEREGSYYIEYQGVKSPVFSINTDIYNGAADHILNYMRQQRCGYNPYLNAECHQHDGYIVDDAKNEGKKIDVTGGWHDATDYLQYSTTSVNAVFQMLFAWQQTPDKTIFKDNFDNLGRANPNGIPDILDEAIWGLDWMLKMNPDSAVIYNQIADDRDHSGFRLPTNDSVDYGWGKGTGRPVFPVTGKPQGLIENNKNRSTGVSSTAAKFASAFYLAANILKDIDPHKASIMHKKAREAYNWSKAKPGNNQTACTVSPYFYEEDNWVDDMELAAATKYEITKKTDWLNEANYWGQLEEITPWMELGRARHYQFYPFVNLGHYYLATSSNPEVSTQYTNYMKKGLEAILKRAKESDDPFLNGIPFIWCSNNLTVAAITQAQLYYQVSKDKTFLEMEASLRDWLFGCNPWGTSMISGLPENENNANRVHSSYYILQGDQNKGGLVDGPIYKNIFSTLRGVNLMYEDKLAPFQNGIATYHNDPGDYSSNEPTMDGTASLSFYLSTLEKIGKKNKTKDYLDSHGAITRKNMDSNEIRLIFSIDSNFEGLKHILNVLKRKHIKASFFLTGNALNNTKLKPFIKQIIKESHYIGGHSDKHILYANWEDRTSLVSKDSLIADLDGNRIALEKWKVDKKKAQYYLPPYEWYNSQNIQDIKSYGWTPVNFTNGLRTAADYTTPEMSNYLSSQEIINQLYDFESLKGLNGAIILIHPGTEETRTDKLYLRLDEIIEELQNRNYKFTKF